MLILLSVIKIVIMMMMMMMKIIIIIIIIIIITRQVLGRPVCDRGAIPELWSITKRIGW